MTTLFLVLALGMGHDSLPPTILAPVIRRIRDTIFVTSPNPLVGKQPYDPAAWTRIPPALQPKKTPPVRMGLKILLPFVAGATWGLHETISHHWPAFERRHPGANAQWWNPAESWRNKYRHGDPESGRTGVPVQFTDAKHLLVLTHNATLFGAGVCVALGGKRRKWWRFALDAGAALGAYSAGNFFIYNTLYRPP